MPPVASAVGRTARPNIDPAEWEQRVNLAACYRLIEHFGWTDLIYTHISARVGVAGSADTAARCLAPFCARWAGRGSAGAATEHGDVSGAGASPGSDEGQP